MAALLCGRPAACLGYHLQDDAFGGTQRRRRDNLAGLALHHAQVASYDLDGCGTDKLCRAALDIQLKVAECDGPQRWFTVCREQIGVCVYVGDGSWLETVGLNMD